MSSDWESGDLALCVGTHPMYPPAVQPGAILTVEYVWPGSSDVSNPSHVDTALDFVGVERMPGDASFWQGNFRKIHPHEPDEQDAETIRLLCSEPVLA